MNEQMSNWLGVEHQPAIDCRWELFFSQDANGLIGTLCSWSDCPTSGAEYISFAEMKLWNHSTLVATSSD